MIPYFPPPMLEIPLGGLTLPLHGFGFLVALGFIVGGNVSMKRAERIGVDPNIINRLIGWLIIGTFVGGHVGYGLMYEPKAYFEDPIKFLQVWQGLSSYGGFAVCVPLSVWFFWREKAPVWKCVDCLAVGLAVGWFFGRMGCFVAHDHPGSITDFFLGVQGICKPDTLAIVPDILSKDRYAIACHDMGLYEALWSLSMFIVYKIMDRRAWKPGIIVCLLGLSYGPARFMMDFLRPVSTDPRTFGFTPGQYWSLFLTAFCAYLLWGRWRSTDEPVMPTAPQKAL